MRKLLALLMLVFALPAQAGTVEIEGQWYALEEILIPGGPSHCSQKSENMTKCGAIRDSLTMQPARIMGILGTKWQMEWNTNHYLNSRFWGLQEPTFTVSEYDSGSYGVYFESSLTKPFVWKDGITYEFRLTKGTMTREKLAELFIILGEIGGDVGTSYEEMEKGIRCVEFKGKLSWSNFDGKDTKENYFKYVFLVDSFKVMEYLPVRFSEESISLEEATARCTSKG